MLLFSSLTLRFLSQFLQSIDPGQQFTWEHSNLEVNKPKNRYANVIAYDHSRVILLPIEGTVASLLLRVSTRLKLLQGNILHMLFSLPCYPLFILASLSISLGVQQAGDASVNHACVIF